MWCYILKFNDSTRNQLHFSRVPYLPDDLKPQSSTDDQDPFADDSTDPWDEDDDFQDNSDPLADLYPKFLCPIFNELETVCLEDSILELFAKNGKITQNDIVNLTNEEIVNIINTRNIRYCFLDFSKIDFVQIKNII